MQRTITNRPSGATRRHPCPDQPRPAKASGEQQHGLPLDPESFRWEPSTETTPDAPTFDELRRWAQLKKRIKRGPKLPRKLLAEWVHQQVLKAGLK